MIKKIALLLTVFIGLSSAWAQPQEISWYSKTAENTYQLNIELFLSSECTHCYNANQFFNSLELQNSWLHVNRHFINKDKEALILFNHMLSEQGMDDFAVPSIYICGSRWVGFANPQTTGTHLIQAIEYCRTQIQKDGQLTQTTKETLRQQAFAANLDAMVTGTPSLTYYLLVVSLMDSLNPCAMFWLAGLLAFLILDKNSKGFIAGLIYLVTGMLLHWYQQTNIGHALGLEQWLRIPAVFVGLLGIVLIYFHWQHRIRASLVLLMAPLFSAFIMLYQQTCQINWAYVFELWIKNQNTAGAQSFLYHLAYQMVFLTPYLLAMLFLIWFYNSKKMQRYQRILQYTLLLMLMIISILLVVYPIMLSYSFTSVGFILLSMFAGWGLTFVL